MFWNIHFGDTNTLFVLLPLSFLFTDFSSIALIHFPFSFPLIVSSLSSLVVTFSLVSILFPAISNEYFCSVIIMLFSFAVCFPRSKISFFSSFHLFHRPSHLWLLIFLEFTFLLKCSICGKQLWDNSMDWAELMFFFLVKAPRLAGKEYFMRAGLGIIFPV